jgi:hypothetical protein
MPNELEIVAACETKLHAMAKAMASGSKSEFEAALNAVISQIEAEWPEQFGDLLTPEQTQIVIETVKNGTWDVWRQASGDWSEQG